MKNFKAIMALLMMLVAVSNLCAVVSPAAQKTIDILINKIEKDPGITLSAPEKVILNKYIPMAAKDEWVQENIVDALDRIGFDMDQLKKPVAAKRATAGRKGSAKRTPSAKRATSKKTPARKTPPAKKAPARKTPARKTAPTKRTVLVKEAPVRKGAAVKRTAPVKREVPEKSPGIAPAPPVKRIDLEKPVYKRPSIVTEVEEEPVFVPKKSPEIAPAPPVRRIEVEKPVYKKIPMVKKRQTELAPVFMSAGEQAQQCNSLILILDPNLNEDISGESIALGLKFIDELYEKAAPLIVSRNIVENFCFWKTTHKEMLEAVKNEAMRTKNIDAATKKAEELLKQLEQEKQFTERGSVPILLSGVELSGNDWDCYMHDQADLVLLVPKKYRARRAVDIRSGAAQMEACGFNVTSLDKIDDVSPESVLKQIQSNKIENSINIVDAIQSMFKIEKPSEETEPTPWNIYLVGHGGPAKKKKVMQKKLEANQEFFVHRQTMIPFYRQMAETYRIRGDLESEETYLRFAGWYEKENERHLALLKVIEKFSDEDVVPGTAAIAGISFDDFARLMSFFDSVIETTFMHYSTCFGGGYNQTFVNEVLQKLKVNFIVSSEGVSESSTYAFGVVPQFNARGELGVSNMRFTNFFGLLETFFGEPTKIVGMKMPKDWRKDPIAAIVRTVADLSEVANQPFVRIPAVGVFTALDVDKKVKILTNTVVKAYELEGRTIDIANPEIKTLIVYPAYIGVPIKMRSLQDVLSPTPQKVEQLYKTTHIFEEIISDAWLSHFLSNFVRLNSSYSKITFVIKKLTCHNYPKSGLDSNRWDLSIENMIIQIAGNLSENSEIDTDINVVFMLDGQTYSFLQHLKGNILKIINSFDMFDVPLSSSQGNLIDKILDPKEAAQLRDRSVAGIVEYFESLINKDFGVQKVGALKKVLLLKELDGLEKATEPEALQAQKEWLASGKKPGVTFATSLNRQKKEVARLKADVGKLTPAEMPSAERNTALDKIKNIETIINNELASVAGK